MSTSGGQPSSKSLTVGSQSGSLSQSTSARGGALRRRRAKPSNEKKIAEDEFMAAAIGDVEWLRQSLRENGSQIHHDKNGLTALHLAAIHGRLDCLKLCIEKFKQDKNLASSTGWRPVHLVISNQTGKRALQCLTYLLEKGADPSIENDDGITPVHQAASEGHVQCLKLLIEVGAKVDGRDCRGNTPLDLAKLWAHRKCARILASEMWHQDKNNVAQEMHQLKKVKMQQVLRELEEEEENKLDQQFYGQAAYEQWMSTRGLNPKKPALQTEPSTTKPKKGKVQIREPLTKPNSVASGGPTAQKGALTMSVSIGHKSNSSKDSSRRNTIATSEADFGQFDGDAGDTKEEPTPEACPSTYVNPNQWNPSPFIPKKEYVTILKDEYPRDEYTVMPRTQGAKKFFDGKHATDDEAEADEQNQLKKKKLRRPKLPKEIVEKVLSGDPTLDERPVVFKPKHIFDVHKKHNFTLDEKPVSEVPLHICNDISSQMVKMSIRFPPDPNKDYFIHRQRGKHGKVSTAGSSSSSSKTSAYSDWNSDMYPLPALLTTLKQMSKPDHFPNLHGQTYGMSFGDLASH